MAGEADGELLWNAATKEMDGLCDGNREGYDGTPQPESEVDGLGD